MTYEELIEEIRTYLPVNKRTGKVFVQKLADELNIPQRQVWHWVVKMDIYANGPATLKLLAWAEQKRKEKKELLSKVGCGINATEPERCEP